MKKITKILFTLLASCSASIARACATCLGRLTLDKNSAPFFSSEYLTKKPIFYDERYKNNTKPKSGHVQQKNMLKKER